MSLTVAPPESLVAVVVDETVVSVLTVPETVGSAVPEELLTSPLETTVVD